jgi:8-oxo-dGTP pyrophosphatase MutT (NUDIX family)
MRGREIGTGTVAAGLILRRSVGRSSRWLLLRNSRTHEWGFPKGHQEDGEELRQTALRECAEESGIALLCFEGPPLEVHYRLPSGRVKRVVYYPAVTGTVRIALSDEHEAGGWFAFAQVRERLTHDNLRALFESCVRETCATGR